MESNDQTTKTRESKLYTSKAEVHLTVMKAITPVPKIDPLSRKIAETITKRELQELGIKTTSNPSKPVLLQNFPKKVSSAKSATAHKSSKPQISRKSLEPVARLIKDEPETFTPKENKRFSIVTPEDLSPVVEQINIRQLKRKKTLKTIEDMNCFNAFRDELNKDYPELELDVSIEGSSFHTHELNELEDAEKELIGIKSGAFILPMPFSAGFERDQLKSDEKVEKNLRDEFETKGTRLGNEKEKHRSEYNSETQNAKETEKVMKFNAQCITKYENKHELGVKENFNTQKLTLDNEKELNQPTKASTPKKRPPELKQSTSEFSLKTKVTPTHSKYTSLNFEPSSASTFNKCLKASSLHSPQESINISVPRCHIDLLNNQTTPVYFNFRLPNDSRVKTPNGLGSVHSLRHMLLSENSTPATPKVKDMYEKNRSWAMLRDEKVRKNRESLDLQAFEKCSFSPFCQKKRMDPYWVGMKSGMNSPRFSIDSVNSVLKITEKRVEGFDLYCGLSPAYTKVRYSDGCNFKQMSEKGKPLVSYQQINLLT